MQHPLQQALVCDTNPASHFSCIAGWHSAVGTYRALHLQVHLVPVLVYRQVQGATFLTLE